MERKNGLVVEDPLYPGRRPGFHRLNEGLKLSLLGVRMDPRSLPQEAKGLPVDYGLAEHVAVLLEPRGVVHLGHQGLHAAVSSVVAVVEAHRVEAVPEVAQVGEDAEDVDD